MEYELKFRADQETLQAILAEYPGERQSYEMQTTYYDTPSGALSARHYTLRRRMENSISVCTLKTPAKGQGRNEIEIPCDTIENAIGPMGEQGAPADFRALVEEGLIPVCGAKFHRIAIPVAFGQCQLELALDAGVLTGGGKEIPLCEVEVELKSGSTQEADLFALILANTHHLTPEAKSKFRRALALYRGE